MLIQDRDWRKIRDQFSSAEKAKLRDAVTGSSICPSGNFVNEKALHNDLRIKLLSALKVEPKL